jgi:hypothetical protein
MTASILDNVDAVLDKKLIDQGLPIISSTSEYDKYVNMSYSELKSISGTSADDASYILEQCALHLQKTCNRLNAKLIQVENNLHKALSYVFDDYKTYGGFEIVLQKACTDNPEINELNDMKIDLKMQITDLSFLSNHITKMANTVSNMKWRNR